MRYYLVLGLSGTSLVKLLIWWQYFRTVFGCSRHCRPWLPVSWLHLMSHSLAASGWLQWGLRLSRKRGFEANAVSGVTIP
jgi:hypothetical protein